VDLVLVLVGAAIVAVWLMLIEWVCPDDVLEELALATRTTITTMAATTSAIPPATAQPWSRD